MLNISGDTPVPSSDISGNRIFSEWKIVFLSVVLMMTIMTFIGNIFVITSVRLERRLQTPTNYLTLSLAVTDLLVSVLVMPLSLINVISHNIVLIPFVCHVWIILDVSLCTVSIFHLLVIAVDRYRSVTNINYRCRRSTRKIFVMVGICWSVGLVIAIPLVVGVFDPKYDPSITGQCLIDQSVVYTLFSTIFAFYIPAFAMVTIYYNIYKIAKSSIRKTYFKKLLIKEDKQIRRSSAPEFRKSSKRRHRTSFANFRYHFGRSHESFESSRSHSSACETVSSCVHVNRSNLPNSDLSQVHNRRCLSRTSLDSSKIPSSSIKSNSLRSPCSIDSCDTDSGYTDCHSSVDGNRENIDVHQPDTSENITDYEDQIVCSSSKLGNPRSTERRCACMNDRRENSSFSCSGFYNHRESADCSDTSFSDHVIDTIHSRASIDGRCISFSNSSFVSSSKSSRKSATTLEIKNKQISKIDDENKPQTINHSPLHVRRGANSVDKESMQIFTIGNDDNLENNSTICSVRRGNVLNLSEEKKRHESKRERRAARTLGIITGTFIICWLPFFIVALISPLINSKVNVPESVQNFVLWLGYLNCLLNPIIYTVFNPEFRKAFRKLLFCRYCKTRRIN
ncbi:5-hydroxytryptamine receptor 1F-like [Pecten maximus]|uniref:5-hydroxytryptamine receptor 1F-like n=1 Tax=Pecten maximus TaxID=6579 RepID=UPI0014581A4F|nr:5-hydroxytryptamine receptor 1F-like [Pecten maximus]